jgi:hypothetical protein
VIVMVQKAPLRWLHNTLTTSCGLALQLCIGKPNGTHVFSSDSGVAKVLERARLRKDPKLGRNRGIYSFCHSYATWRLQAGRSPIEIARNMGTSLAMIERHCYHYMLRIVADRLTSRTAVGEMGSLGAGESD